MKNKKYKIALVSLDQIWEDKALNWILCRKYIDNASKLGADIIIFPEMTLTGFSLNIKTISEDKVDSETIGKFSRIAKTYNIAIIFGMVTKNKSKAYNKSIFISTDGSVVGDYIKIHPFSFVNEDEYIDSGNKLEIVEFESIRIGLSICYDLRFPEIYSAMASNCDIIINIANWPKKRIDHWYSLLKARAIENQIYIAGVNRIGVDGNNLEYEESSCIYDFNGELLMPSSSNHMHVYKIDTQLQENNKNSFNALKDRKRELYKGVL